MTTAIITWLLPLLLLTCELGSCTLGLLGHFLEHVRVLEIGNQQLLNLIAPTGTHHTTGILNKGHTRDFASSTPQKLTL